MTYALINLFAWLVLAHFVALAADRLHPAQAQDADCADATLSSRSASRGGGGIAAKHMICSAHRRISHV